MSTILREFDNTNTSNVDVLSKVSLPTGLCYKKNTQNRQQYGIRCINEDNISNIDDSQYLRFITPLFSTDTTKTNITRKHHNRGKKQTRKHKIKNE